MKIFTLISVSGRYAMPAVFIVYTYQLIKYPIFSYNYGLIFSEWVLGNREDLVKDIVEELQLNNREVGSL